MGVEAAGRAKNLSPNWFFRSRDFSIFSGVFLGQDVLTLTDTITWSNQTNFVLTRW
jgi:hypothetical protein